MALLPELQQLGVVGYKQWDSQFVHLLVDCLVGYLLKLHIVTLPLLNLKDILLECPLLRRELLLIVNIDALVVEMTGRSEASLPIVYIHDGLFVF